MRSVRCLAYALASCALACGAHPDHYVPPSSTQTTQSAPVADAGGPTVVDRGQMVDYDTKHPLAGITVTEADQTTTTDAQGNWSLTVPANTPMALSMIGADYTNLLFQQNQLTASVDRGPLRLPSTATFHLGQAAFPGFDTSKAVIYVLVKTTGSCASIAGGTLTVQQPAGASVTYFRHAFPSQSATSFAEGEDPVAAVFNVDPGADVQIKIDHPTCKQAAFPYADGPVTWTSTIPTKAGDANSVAYFWLE